MKLLPFFIIIPLAGAYLVTLLGRRIKYCGDILANIASGVLLLFSGYCLTQGLAHKMIIYKVGGWMPPLGICLVLDGLSAFMLLAVNLIAFLVMVYSISYMEEYTDKWKFHALFMLMLAGMNGLILSGDIFNLYVFLEVASISAYCLVAFGTAAEDLEASFKYAVMGVLGSAFILLGIALLYSYTSALNMADISASLSVNPNGALVGFVSVLFLAGFGLKAAIVPFHAWLPDAHSCAPTPVSAALSGVLIKSLGVYSLCRVFFNVIGSSTQLLFVLMALGVLSMAVGAFLAIAQNDIKRMFAYSSISQVGYIIFALGIGTPLAIAGALFYLFNHAVSKALLFLCAGSIEYATGTRNLDKLGGLNKRMRVTAAASLIGSMSISGIPPLGGFWSKAMIIIAGVQAGHAGFAIIAVLVSILTLAYYLKFQSRVFFIKTEGVAPILKEIPLTMKLSMLLLAIICAILGLALIPALRPFLEGASGVLISGTGYQEIFFGTLK